MAKSQYDLDNTYAGAEDDPYYDPARVAIPGPNGTTIGYSNTTGVSPQTSIGVGDAPGEGIPGPWAIPPADGDWASWFLRNIQGQPPNSSSLEKLIPVLKVHGIEVLKNASGIYGKVKLPTGEIKDVGKAFSSGDPSQMAWQWLDAPEGGGNLDWFDENLGGPEPYEALQRPDYLRGEFKLPEWNEKFAPISMDELQKDPGYQARLAQAQKGFERSAAAKGTILSGGSQIALGREQQNLAANEYGAANSRAFDTYLQRYGQFKDRATAMGAERGINENAFQSDVANNLNQYGTRYKAYRDVVDDQKWLSELGLRATSAGAPR